jgi:hypothetical protein
MLQPPSLSPLPPNPALSDVESTVVGNYGVFHQVADQLLSLRHWVLDQQAISAGKTPIDAVQQ